MYYSAKMSPKNYEIKFRNLYNYRSFYIIMLLLMKIQSNSQSPKQIVVCSVSIFGD